ncbi:MFS transporter [Dongia deserti]|uniref:MFS transporter n=1 Tax=Dongia deserti TaxID=2268030 RepID=UPI000E64D167|nr:MFS transporter [Dongia deserti]
MIAASRWPLIHLIVGAGIVSALQVGKAPAALATVQADLGLDLPTASWLLSAFALVGGIAGIAIGIAVDHVGARRMAIGGLLLQGVASAAGALMSGAAPLLASRLVEGVGFLAVAVAAPALIVAVARPRDLSRAFAEWGTFMPVGMAIVLLAAPILSAIGWRGFWLVNAAILLGYAIVLAVGTRAIAPAAGSRRSIAADIRDTLAARGPWLLCGLFAAFCAGYFAVFGFLPVILSDRLGVSAGTGGVLSAFAIAVNAIGNLVCGILLSRGVRRSHLLLIGFITIGICTFGILSTDVPGLAAYALCVLLSLICGIVPVALIDAAPRYAPRPDLVGATVGFLMQGNNIGLIIGPAAAGYIAGAFGWPAVSFAVALISAVAIFGALALARSAAGPRSAGEAARSKSAGLQRQCR